MDIINKCWLLLSILFCAGCSRPVQKVLFVVTSHEQLGETEKPTGYYLSEVTHPWYSLNKAGYEVDFLSPKGGKAPIDPKSFDLKDSINAIFWKSKKYREKINNTLSPTEVNPSDYKVIHYVGGHGVMWDIAKDTLIAGIASKIYENKGLVTAVCHGPAGLLEIKLKNGEYLLNKKRVAAFTNKEEIAVELDSIVPFLLEIALRDRGAIFGEGNNFQPNVVKDERLITGQNPQSAYSLGQLLVETLE